MNQALRSAMAVLSSTSFKYNPQFKENHQSFFYNLDPRLLTLGYSQFFIALTMLFRRNFNTGESLLSESKSPNNSIVPDARVNYCIRSIIKKGLAVKISHNKFILKTDCQYSIKVPYSFLLNILLSLNEDNLVFIKAALSLLYLKSFSSSSVQSSLSIRKTVACSLAKAIKLSELEINSFTTNYKSILNASYNKISVTIDHNKLHSFIESKKVPNSFTPVPVSPLNYTSLNKKNNLSSTSNLTNISISVEITDRLFYNNFKLSETSKTSKQLDASLMNSEYLKRILPENDYHCVIALSTIAMNQSIFSSISNEHLLKCVAEIYLRIRNNKYSSKITKSARGYFFKALRNEVSITTNDFSQLSSLSKKMDQKELGRIEYSKTLKAIEKIESDKNAEYEELIKDFEIETGKTVESLTTDDGFIIPELVEFSSKHTRHNNNKSTASNHSFKSLSNYSKGGEPLKISGILNGFSKPAIDDKIAVNKILLRLNKGLKINSSEKDLCPLHIQDMLTMSDVDSSGNMFYKIHHK